MFRKVPFLDSINPILRNNLSTLKNFSLPSVEEITSSQNDKFIEFYKTIFYSTEELKKIAESCSVEESTGSGGFSGGVKTDINPQETIEITREKVHLAEMIIRRYKKISAIPEEVNSLDTPYGYFNLYVNYLNSTSYREFLEYLQSVVLATEATSSQTSKNSHSLDISREAGLLVDILRCSKLVHDYEMTGDPLIIKEEKELLKRLAVDLNRTLPEYTPIWLLMHMQLAIKSTSQNPIREYEEDVLLPIKAYQETIGGNYDTFKNIHLNFIDINSDFIKYKDILLSIERRIHYRHLIKFLEVSRRFSLNQTSVEGVHILQFQSEIAQIKENISGFLMTKDIRALFKKECRRIASTCDKIKARVADSLYTAKSEELDDFIENPFVSDEARSLLLAGCRNTVDSPTEAEIIENLRSAILYIPSLSAVFLKKYVHSRDFSNLNTVIDLVENINSTHLKKNLKNLLLYTVPHESVARRLLLSSTQQEICLFLKRFMNIRAFSVDVWGELLSRIDDKKELRSLIVTVSDTDMRIALADRFDFLTRYIYKHMSTLVREANSGKISQLSLLRILDILKRNASLLHTFLSQISESFDFMRNLLVEMIAKDILQKEELQLLYEIYYERIKSFDAAKFYNFYIYLIEKVKECGLISKDNTYSLTGGYAKYQEFLDLLTVQYSIYVSSNLPDETFKKLENDPNFSDLITRFTASKICKDLGAVLNMIVETRVKRGKIINESSAVEIELDINKYPNISGAVALTNLISTCIAVSKNLQLYDAENCISLVNRIRKHYLSAALIGRNSEDAVTKNCTYIKPCVDDVFEATIDKFLEIPSPITRYSHRIIRAFTPMIVNRMNILAARYDTCDTEFDFDHFLKYLQSSLRLHSFADKFFDEEEKFSVNGYKNPQYKIKYLTKNSKLALDRRDLPETIIFELVNYLNQLILGSCEEGVVKKMILSEDGVIVKILERLITYDTDSSRTVFNNTLEICIRSLSRFEKNWSRDALKDLSSRFRDRILNNQPLKNLIEREVESADHGQVANTQIDVYLHDHPQNISSKKIEDNSRVVENASGGTSRRSSIRRQLSKQRRR